MESVHNGNIKTQLLLKKDQPHFAPYLQFLTNIIQIHLEYVKQGGPDYGISDAINKEEFQAFYNYLYSLEPGDPVEINEQQGPALYATTVTISRLLLCEYGERICSRLISKLPQEHRWSRFEAFRNDLLKHNTQLLLDLDQLQLEEKGALVALKERLERITLP